MNDNEHQESKGQFGLWCLIVAAVGVFVYLAGVR